MSENKREKIYTVALLVSAWIETDPFWEEYYPPKVALLVSAWIETRIGSNLGRQALSHSS